MQFTPRQLKIGLVVSLILLLILMGISIKSIKNKPIQTQPVAKDNPIILISPTPKSKSPHIVVTDSDPNLLVNVRQLPKSNSQLITKVRVGQTFPLIQSVTQWFEIQLDSSTSGWISSSYATISGLIKL